MTAQPGILEDCAALSRGGLTVEVICLSASSNCSALLSGADCVGTAWSSRGDALTARR
jgi:hypothetical protein